MVILFYLHQCILSVLGSLNILFSHELLDFEVISGLN